MAEIKRILEKAGYVKIEDAYKPPAAKRKEFYVGYNETTQNVTLRLPTNKTLRQDILKVAQAAKFEENPQLTLNLTNEKLQTQLKEFAIAHEGKPIPHVAGMILDAIDRKQRNISGRTYQMDIYLPQENSVGAAAYVKALMAQHFKTVLDQLPTSGKQEMGEDSCAIVATSIKQEEERLVGLQLFVKENALSAFEEFLRNVQQKPTETISADEVTKHLQQPPYTTIMR